MDFELDEAQAAVAQTAAEVLDDAPDDAWKALAQAGLLALAVPAALGGDGLGLAETGVLLTEIGRRALALPALATLALGVLPVARFGRPELQEELLPGVAAGATLLTAAHRATSVTASGGRTIDGVALGVLYAEQAQRILVPVPPAGVALVDPSGPGVACTRTPTSGDVPEYTVTFDQAPATGFLEPGAAEVLRRCAIAGACATGDGLVAGALALTAGHIATREQFGRPLATFQAVAQQIADVYIASRTVHLASLAASHNADMAEGGHNAADVDVAAYWFASEAPAALRTCHHLHGGLGLDVTYPLHRYSSMVRDLVRFLGGAEQCLDRLGSADVHRAV
jgi:alkylation response protein AidB-like acyl-CoA dehydrogenase